LLDKLHKIPYYYWQLRALKTKQLLRRWRVDRVALRRFVLTFSWALEALQLETKEIWPPEELKWPAMLRRGEKIPADVRILEDRFVRVFRDNFLELLGDERVYWDAMATARTRIFSASSPSARNANS